MTKLWAAALAALVLALGGAAAAQAPAAAPGAPPGSPADPAWQRARLGVGQVQTLEAFAAATGVRLGGSDDGPAFAAANRAIGAAAHSGGLAVALPMGAVEHTSVGLLLDNNGGYFCPAPGQCTVQAVRAPSDAAASWLVSVNDPRATNLVLSGIIFFGGWTYARDPYRQAPETDPWLEKQGGVNITHAFNGQADDAFRSNSKVKAQLPTDHIENLVISAFGGDCLVVRGAGQNTYHNIRGSNCGGRGMVIDSYDNKFEDFDFGGTGRSCLSIEPQGATNYIQGKVWYCGSRLKPGDDVGVRIASGGDLMELIVQDTFGDAIWNSGQLNSINAIVSWQGVIPNMDPGSISAYTCVGCDHNIVTLNASILTRNQAFPNVTRLYRDLGAGGRFGMSNIVTISESGWPQDYGPGVWQPFWFEGPLEGSNRLSVNGLDRAHGQVPDASGRAGSVLSMNGSAVGVVVFGPNSEAPGKVAVLCQGADASSCQLSGFHNTAAAATGTLEALDALADGDTVSISGTTYVFDKILRNIPGHVHLGDDAAASLNNLAHAIDGAGGKPGLDYAAIMTPDPAVTATAEGPRLTVTARIAGTAANALALGVVGRHAVWRSATLAGGAAGTQTYATAFSWDRDGRAGLPNLPGPYANDAAAAGASVPIGYLYRDAASVVHVRTQ